MVPMVTLAKFAAQTVAGMGASKIVTDIIRNNVVVTTTAQRVFVGAGSFVLGSMVFEQSVNHIDRMVNEAVASFKQAKEETETEK